LILEKQRGFFAKFPKILINELFSNGKHRGPGPRAPGPRVAPAHSGPRSPSRGRLAGDRPERRPRAWNLAAVEEKWRGDGGEPHRWQESAAEGRTQPGNGGEQSAEETLGDGELRTQKHAIEGEVSVVMAGGGAPRPFIVAGGGHTRAAEGETAGGNDLSTIDGGLA
jgi:hypothetical protein